MMYSKLCEVLNNQESNYMLPFYWQHGNHYETIPLEVERIYESGCRAFCVESRPHKDFVGEKWWRDMDLILSEAKKRGMEVWILDDDKFPTGHAAGHIEKYYPDKRRWDIAERHIDVMGPVNKSLVLTRESDETKLIGAYAYKRTDADEVVCGDEVIDLCEKANGDFCEVTLPAGLWRVFLIYKTRAFKKNKGYIDMLSRDSVRVLIDAVYESHYEHYKEYFGNTLRGFFSDEPSYGNSWFLSHQLDPGGKHVRLGILGMAYPWCPEVFSQMEKQLGYSPLPYIAALWSEIGDKTPEIRLAYMDAITRLYRDNFTRQLGDWCAKHGVEYIGHVIEDANAHKRTAVGTGHYFRTLDGQHMSGIDIISSQLVPGMSDYFHTSGTSCGVSDPGFFDYTLSKLASSLAHIGRDMKGRAMCELFGAYGWALNCGDMKWILDHLLVRGVNYFVPHAFSPLFPDPDCPPHFGAGGKDPQFEAFGRLMRYGNKAAHLLYGGEHVADAAILYDAELEWMNADYSVNFMQTPAKLLYDENIDYDFLPIDCIVGAKDARIYFAEAENGLLKVGNKTYKALIVPTAPFMPKKLTESLRALEDAGVKIIRIGDDFGQKTLLAEIGALFEPDIKIEGRKKLLHSCHYTDGGNDIYMFVNESITDTADCEISLNSVRSEYGACLDILNDEVSGVKLENKKMKLRLLPNQSAIFVFGKVDFDALPEKKLWSKYTEAELSFKLEIADADDLGDFKLYREDIKSNEPFNITAIDCMPEFSGRMRYTARFDSSDLPNAKKLAIDLGAVGNASRLFINGEDLGIRITKPYLYDLSGKIKKGENELVIEVSNTLGNKLRDRCSAVMSMPAAGLTERIYFVTE